MHMQSAQQVALADHLQVVHDLVVTLLRGLQSGAPQRGRVSAGCEDGQAVFGCHGGDGLAKVAQFRARIRQVAVRRGDHLDLRLKKLRRDAALGRRLGGLEERLRDVGGDALRFRVHQKIFFLYAERKRGARHRALPDGRNNQQLGGCLFPPDLTVK